MHVAEIIFFLFLFENNLPYCNFNGKKATILLVCHQLNIAIFSVTKQLWDCLLIIQFMEPIDIELI